MSDWTGAGTAATTVTYDDALSTDRDKVRFHLADTVESSGPRPSGGNFTDDEIAGLVTIGGDWERAVAMGLDRLAVEWAQYADLKEGPHDEKNSQIAARFAERAEKWKEQHGITAPCYTAGVIKQDGYSDDVTSDDVDTSTEYGIVWERVTVKD